MIVDDDDDDQEDDAETLEYLSQYSNELTEQMNHEFGNEQGGDFGNEQGGDDAGGANNDGRACEGMKMTVTIWRKCFGPLDQKYY
jgi:hypothetical protein